MDLGLELITLKTESRNLPTTERAKLGCGLAKQFEKIGEYQKAYEALIEFWPDRTQPPNVEGLDEFTKAEVLLRTGALAGWLGAADQTEGGQERAKNLLTKSVEIFERLAEADRVAEARGELALCYWREGSYDEARITLENALSEIQNDAELKATLLIRAGIVEVDSRHFGEAFRFYNKVIPLLDRSQDDALKGSFHVSFAILFRRLATNENNSKHIDQALIEYAAASFHFEQAGNRRYQARVENSLAFLYFSIGRYKDAHEHLDRARNLFIQLNDVGMIAHVDETRARTLLAEGHAREAERVIKMAVKSFEKGDQQALLAEALTTHGTVMARLGNHARARLLFQRAIGIAETCGDLEGAGRARLSIIEELSDQTPAEELASILHAAADLLEKSQDPAASNRLVLCGLKTVDALLAEMDEQIAVPTDKDWKNFSLKREIRQIEARFIERALRDAGGSVTRASKMLGFNHHQSLIALLSARHSDLESHRSIKRRRRRPLMPKIKAQPKPSSGELSRDQKAAKLSILHVEDHKPFARIVRDLLTDKGMNVDLSASGASAWQILKSDVHYDALVVDNNLPGVSGLELILRVRSMPHRRNLPIIMLSSDDLEKEAWRAGADAFLRKPEGAEQLAATIARAIEDRQE